MAIQVMQNADGSLTLLTTVLGPITATATSITIAGQFTLPGQVDPRVAIARADAVAAEVAAHKVVADLA